jgi:hypothetical protein
MKLLCACFVAVLLILMSFAFVARELRRAILTMLETHIVMSSLSFHLILTLMLRLALLLMLCLISLRDLTIAHMILVHGRIAFYLDALVPPHVLIVIIIFRKSPVFLLEGLALTQSPGT